MARSFEAVERTKHVAITAWAIIGVLLVAYALVWVLGRIMPALVPFILAGIIVLLLRSPVQALVRRGVPRVWAVVICYLIALAVLGVAGAFIIPMIVEQVAAFLTQFPSYYRSAVDWWTELEQQVSAITIPNWAQSALDQIGDVVTSRLSAWGASLAGGVVSAGGATATFLVNSFLAAVIAFWILRDLPKMRREIVTLAGERREQDVEFFSQSILMAVGGYVRGQLIISTVTGVIVWVGLALLGIPYALVLGIITGLFNIVPYVGPLIAAVISAIVAAFVSPLAAVLSILVILGAQNVVDTLVTPRVMSEQVDLHPVLVIFSLLVGATLLGFWGVFVAIPLAAVAKGAFVYYYQRGTRRTIASKDGALFKSNRPDKQEEAESTATGDEPRDGSAEDSALEERAE